MTSTAHQANKEPSSSENIRVAVRVRGRLDVEQSRGVLWTSDESDCSVVSHESRRVYNFDRVFGPLTSTDDVYDTLLASKVKSVTQGFNATIFAYGQTASGKTYTMLGSYDQPGIMPLAVIDIFNQILETQEDKQWIIRASYLEIYNEHLIDLLVEPHQRRPLHIQEDNKKGDCLINGLTEISVTTVEEVFGLIEQGESHRSYGVTDMNERSSRSHTIFRLTVESLIVERVGSVEGLDDSSVRCGNAITVGRLNLVDLAGSERAAHSGAVADRLREGGNINKSLLALGQVIAKLSEGAKDHIPYRTSKLTRILKHSLGGNSKTSIICTISPVEREQTKSTLDFATRAKTISTRSFKNEILDDTAHLATMRREIVKLNEELQEERESKLKSTQELEDKVAKLQNQMLFSFGNTPQPEERVTRENRRKSWHPNLMLSRKSTAFDLKPLPADLLQKLSTISEQQTENEEFGDHTPQTPPFLNEPDTNAFDCEQDGEKLNVGDVLQDQEQCHYDQQQQKDQHAIGHRLSAIAEEDGCSSDNCDDDHFCKVDPEEMKAMMKELEFLKAKLANACYEADALKEELLEKKRADQQEQDSKTSKVMELELQHQREEMSFAVQEAQLLREELSQMKTGLLANLETELESKDRELNSMNTRLRHEEQRCGALNDQLEIKERENNVLSSAIATNEEKIVKLKGSSKEIKEVVVAMKNDLDKKEDEINRLQELLTTKQAVIEEMESQVEASKLKSNQVEDDYEQQMTRELEDLRRLLKEAEMKISDQSKQISKAANLEAQLDEKNDMLRSLEMTLQHRNECSARRERDLVEYSTKKGEEVKGLEEKLEQLKATLEEKEIKNRKLIRFQKDIKETMFSMRHDLEEKDRVIENLRYSINNQQEHSSQRNEYNDIIELHRNELQLQQDNYLQLEDDHRKLKEDFNALSSQLNEKLKSSEEHRCKVERNLDIKKLELVQEREEVKRLKNHLRRYQSTNMDTSLMPPRKKNSTTSLKSLPASTATDITDDSDGKGFKSNKKDVSVSTDDIASNQQEDSHNKNHASVFGNVEWTSGSTVSKEAFLQIFARKNRKLESKLNEIKVERDALQLQVQELKASKESETRKTAGEKTTSRKTSENLDMSDVENKNAPSPQKSVKSGVKKNRRPSFAWLNNALRTPLRERNKASETSDSSSSTKGSTLKQQSLEEEPSSTLSPGLLPFPKSDMSQFY